MKTKSVKRDHTMTNEDLEIQNLFRSALAAIQEVNAHQAKGSNRAARLARAARRWDRILDRLKPVN